MNENAPLSSARASLAQLPRYGVVGVISNTSGYLVYLLLTALGGEPKLVMTLVYLIGVSGTVKMYENRRFEIVCGNLRIK